MRKIAIVSALVGLALCRCTVLDPETGSAITRPDLADSAEASDDDATNDASEAVAPPLEVDALASDAAPTDLGPTPPDDAMPDVGEPPDTDTRVIIPDDDPFNRGVLSLSLDFEPIALGLLLSDPTRPIPAQLAMGEDEAITVWVTMPPSDHQRDLTGKPTFAVRVPPSEGEASDATVPNLTLSSMVSDPSHLRERVTHHVASRLGLAVPRSTYARLTLDGEDLGLYVATEATDSPAYLARAASAEGSLFSTRDRADLWPWQVASLELVEGDDADRTSLDLLASRLETFRIAHLEGKPLTLAEALEGQVDLSAFTLAMAVDIALGHWAGYGRGLWAFSLHVAPDSTVTFLPESLGMSLDPSDIPNPWGGGGKLLWQCRLDAACRTLLGDALRAVGAALPALEAEASALRFVALRELQTDTRREVSDEEILASQAAVLGDLTNRPGWLAANLACASPGDVDRDGDNASACTDDCDDDRADVHPGAAEQCNLRDDDCDGVLDDAPSCPPCVEVEGPHPGSTWVLCHAPRTWEGAHEDCLSRGGELVTIDGEETQVALVRRALSHQWRSWWLGLNDRDTEGSFTWSDRTSSTFGHWNDGEPNDYAGREDCVELTPWGGGLWNDLPCDRELPYVCTLP
jgi:hypothetical protein